MIMALYRFIGRNSEAVFIVDEDRPGQRSVTNAAEDVVLEVFRCWGNRRIIYRDTDGRWDELMHVDGTFTGFTTLSDRDRHRFQEWLISVEEPSV